MAPSPPPPVIVAAYGALSHPFPVLEGRYRQTLPKVPGKLQGVLLPGKINDRNACGYGRLEAWLIPWRVGSERTLIITIRPGTVLRIDVSKWPELQPHQRHTMDADQKSRDRTLRRAARVLDLAADIFSAQPSVDAAYRRLEEIWNDPRNEDIDPLGELLKKQAKKLKSVLDALGSRPRAVLHTEHRMLKLQDARRIDTKTLRWFSAQPGRNVAERAGARQRIKAPKRYETVATLENQVLRAFAALTIREAENWLSGRQTERLEVKTIRAHQLRARRVEGMLKRQKVPEAVAPITPNFPLRFDRRYRDIWRAWQDLRARSIATELEWMWQHRTFMELLGLRAAMKLHEEARKKDGFGMLAHNAVLRAEGAPSQGHYFEEGVQCTFGKIRSGSIQTIGYKSGRHECRLGAVAETESDAGVWWDALDTWRPASSDVTVGELPWSREHAWDARLSEWAARIIS